MLVQGVETGRARVSVRLTESGYNVSEGKEKREEIREKREGRRDEERKEGRAKGKKREEMGKSRNS